MPNVTPLPVADPGRVGQYRLAARLVLQTSEDGPGPGGPAAGTIYLARTGRNERVTITLLDPLPLTDSATRDRFIAEARAARRVAPFCAARIIDSGFHRDFPYIVCEYVAGPTVGEEVLRDGPASGDALQAIAIGSATGLAAIHQAGLVHGDFGPHRVVLGADGPRILHAGISPPYGPFTPTGDLQAWAHTVLFAASGDEHAPARPPDVAALPEPLREVIDECLDPEPASRPTAKMVVTRLLGYASTPAGVLAEGSRVSRSLAGTATGSGTATAAGATSRGRGAGGRRRGRFRPAALPAGPLPPAALPAGSPAPGSPAPGSPPAGSLAAASLPGGSPAAGSLPAGSTETGSAEAGPPEAGSPSAASPAAGSPAAGSLTAGSLAGGLPPAGSVPEARPDGAAPGNPAATGTATGLTEGAATDEYVRDRSEAAGTRPPDPPAGAVPDRSADLAEKVPAARPRPSPASRRPGRTGLAWAGVAAGTGAVAAIGAFVFVQHDTASQSPAPAAGHIRPADQRPSASRSSAPAPSGSATPEIPSAFSGTWTGNVHQRSALGLNFPAQITLRGGSQDGTVNYSSLGCSGPLTPVSASNQTLVLQQGVVSGQQTCGQGTITLTRGPDGTLGYSFAPQVAGGPSTTGTLSHQ